MFRTRMTRDAAEAERMAEALRARVGELNRWGRITDTLVGVEVTSVDCGGRPMHIVKPLVRNRDPLFDA